MSFRLDKSFFKKQSFDDAENTRAYWLSISPMERIRASIFLQYQVYGLPIDKEPRMEKHLFSIKRLA
jgi:hypothetical protein